MGSSLPQWASVAIEGRGEPVWSAPRGLSGPSRRALGARIPWRTSPEGTTTSRRTPLRVRRLIRRMCRASERHGVEVERGVRWRARWREGRWLGIETCVGEHARERSRVRDRSHPVATAAAAGTAQDVFTKGVVVILLPMSGFSRKVPSVRSLLELGSGARLRLHRTSKSPCHPRRYR